jgi:hypothetical protein
LASASPPRLHFVQAEGRRRITICISLKILNAILEHRTKYKKKKNFISLKFTVSLFWIFLLAISLNTHYLVKRTSSRTFSFLI